MSVRNLTANPNTMSIEKMEFGDSAGGAEVTVVAAVTAKKILVKSWWLVTDGANGLWWKSNATKISGKIQAGATSGLQYGHAYCPAGSLVTAAGEPLVLSSNAASPFGWVVVYVEVD